MSPKAAEVTASKRAELTPQMLQYAEKFDDRGDIRWLPYLMYFHAIDHRSEVVNTDRLGFRLCHGPSGAASLGGPLPEGPVRLLAGSSTVFGIGATNDAATLPSRLWTRHAPSLPWLNFGARSHNSAQELLLFVLYRHLLPPVEEIVLFSGFNNLGLARLPRSLQGDHGAFFNCIEFFEQMEKLRASHRKPNSVFLRPRVRAQAPELEDTEVLELEEQISTAAELTIRHLAIWNVISQSMGARLTYVLQPLATWVRKELPVQERQLFEELDTISNFGQVYGDIAAMDSGRRYSQALEKGCRDLGVRYLDMSPVIAAAVKPDHWLFVDRIHFTDDGYDFVAGLLADSLELS